MIRTLTLVLGALSLVSLPAAQAQSGLSLPATVLAGSAFSVQSGGNGKAVLYITGPGGAMRRDVQRGDSVSIAAGTLINAGQYLAALVGGSSTDTQAFQVVPADQAAKVSFLAEPSRLPVGIHDGISGAAFVFDAYRNLITTPEQVTFQLAGDSGDAVQTKTVTTHDGAAWTQMDSAPKQGSVKFVARVGDVTTTRVVQEVPGDPCGLHVTAKPDGNKIQLQTDPLKDCSGNAVPDGTVVTFTEQYNGEQTTVDVPLKHGVAQAVMPAYNGARISVATGVVMGNEIHWGRP